MAELFGVSVSLVRKWRTTGRGPRYIKLGSSVRYSDADLDAFLESRPTGGGSPADLEEKLRRGDMGQCGKQLIAKLDRLDKAKPPKGKE